MKGVQSKFVCRYCRKTIDKKPIPVKGSDPVVYAHQGCIRQERVRRNYIAKS